MITSTSQRKRKEQGISDLESPQRLAESLHDLDMEYMHDVYEQKHESRTRGTHVKEKNIERYQMNDGDD